MSRPATTNYLGDLFDEFRGRKLSAVLGTFYVKDGIKNDLPLDVLLVFAGDAEGLCIGCASDGESLCLNKGVISGYSMQELGRVDVFDISNLFVVKGGVGAELQGASAIMTKAGVVAGVEIEFSSGNVLFFVNRGDDLIVADALPSFLSDEGVVKERIR